MPQRIGRRRAKGWRLPAGTVIIDRTSRYGNPYRVVRHGDRWDVLRPAAVGGLELDRSFGGDTAEADARAHAVTRYEAALPDLVAPEDLERLRGMDLACTCDPADGMACHGDVLLRVANAPR